MRGLSKDSVQPDIFFFSNLLEEKFPEFFMKADDEAVTSISISIAEILAETRGIAAKIIPELHKVPAGDMEKLEDQVANLHEVLLHIKTHLEEADEALWKLFDM